MKKLIVILLLLMYLDDFGQLLDLNRVPAYHAVFEETDAFDSSYLTQLENAYFQPLPDSLKLEIGCDLAYYWHTRNLIKAHQWANAVLTLAKNTNNNSWVGRLQVILGAILLRQEKLDSAYIVLESAKAILPKKEWSLLLTQEGYVMERRGLISKAADFAMDGLHLGDSIKNLRTQAMAYSDLSNLLWKQSKFDNGLEYGLKSEDLFKKRGIDDMDYSFTLYIIGNNYMGMKDYKNALNYYNQALAISYKYQFYNNLDDIYIALTDLYTTTTDYSKAEEAAKNAIKYGILLDNSFMLMRAWLSLGKLQNLTNRPSAAIKSLDTCLIAATEKFGDKFFLHQAYKELATAYSATGDYQKAYAAFLKYDVLKDSVFTAESDQRVSTLQTEFEVAQKENTIKSQEQSILQQKKLQLLTLGAAILLVLILVGLYRNYRSKRLTNAKLESLNSDLGHKNLQLDKRNAENELLLKEIHHRVKNNLEVVSALLALQAEQIDHPSAQAVMQASQNRVQSMGIIHQKLYLGGSLASIEMKEYFQQLSESIANSFNSSNHIVINCNMDPLELDVDTAIPIGLIANELITNSLKYAFEENQPGEIQISLLPTADKADLIFRVADTGIGKNINQPPKGTGFGTELVNLLVQQLGGKLTMDTSNGTSILIQFKYT